MSEPTDDFADLAVNLQAYIDEQPAPPHPKFEHPSGELKELSDFLWNCPLALGRPAALRQMATPIAQSVLNWQAGWIYDMPHQSWVPLGEQGAASAEDIAAMDDPKFDVLDDKTKAKAVNAMLAFAFKQDPEAAQRFIDNREKRESK